jgi:hypothetical protein
MWKWFVELAQKQQPAWWHAATNEKKFALFVGWMSRKTVTDEYERRIAEYERQKVWAADVVASGLGFCDRN